MPCSLLAEHLRLDFYFAGEICGGIEMSGDNNDTEVLMDSLGDCCQCSSHDGDTICSRKNIPELLSLIKGPWALIYWQVSLL